MAHDFRPSWLGRLAPVVVAAVLLTGCGDAGTAHRAQPADQPSHQAAAASTSAGRVGKQLPPLPVTAYQLSPQQVDTISTARLILAAQCLAGKGFPPPRIAAVHEEASTAGRFQARRYGAIDPASAAEYGYHLPATKLGDPTGVDPFANVTPAARSALYGTGDQGGCLGQALTELDGQQIYEDSPAAARIDFQSFDAAKSSATMRPIFAQWSACMKASGFSYPDPMASINDHAYSSKQPSAREISAAVADVACKQRYQVVDRWHATEVLLQNASIRANAESLTRIYRQLTVQYRTASRIVAGYHPS